MEELENKIQTAYDKLGINNDDSYSNLEKKIENKLENKLETKIDKSQISNYDLLNQFCSEYHNFACEQAPICIEKKINTYSTSACDSRGDSSNLEGLYKLIVNKINNLKTEVVNENNDINNGKLIKSEYGVYQDSQTKINTQHNDNILINEKNNIMDIKINNNLNKLKMYSLVVILLTILNIGFYILILKK